MSRESVRRAVVTGLGVISPIGNDLESFIDSVLSARSGIDLIKTFDTSPFRTPYGGEVRGFYPLEAGLTEDEISLLNDRYLQLGLSAARSALANAGLSWSCEDRPGPRAGLVVGTCNGGLLSAQRQYEFLVGKGGDSLDRKMNLLIRYHSLGKALTHTLGIDGSAWVISTACSSSTCALALALEMISNGIVDVVLAGGTDALCMATMAGFDSIKATSTDRIAPFSLPTGLNLGEGAAFWVVEESQTATERGARIEGELLGHAFTADGHHPTAPDPRGEGAYRTMVTALARADVKVSDLGCINLHGTGTEANDRIETKAVARFLGDTAIPAYSFKSQVGHCLGAAGILEATAGLTAMNEGVIPATINFDEPRPGCNLDYVPNEPRKNSYDRFLSCNYAFGGHNAGIVVGRYMPERPPAPRTLGRTRTVLTGSGVISSLGIGSARLLSSLRENNCGLVSASDRVKGRTEAKLGGFVPKFDTRDVDRRLDLKQMNLISSYATVAARLALLDAGIRLSPKTGRDIGVISGIYVGTDEEDYMLEVIRSGGAKADISSFATIVPNAMGGWISNALALRGYSCTVTMGADAGLFAILFSHLAILSESSERIVAGAADELYSRYYMNYDELGLLHTGEHEKRYRLRPELDDRRVLSEGAAYLVVEELHSARKRDAVILAEIVGHGQTTDSINFFEPNRNPGGLARAIQAALDEAGWSARDVGLITWSPQGNGSDLKVVEALDTVLLDRASSVPMITSVFHTGLSEASSGTMTLAAMLNTWANGGELWSQTTGLEEIDSRSLPLGPVPTLAIATSDLGYNLVLAIAPGEGVS